MGNQIMSRLTFDDDNARRQAQLAAMLGPGMLQEAEDAACLLSLAHCSLGCMTAMTKHKLPYERVEPADSELPTLSMLQPWS
jgi:hypothetical protein